MQRLGFDASQRFMALQHPAGVFAQMPDRYLTAKHRARGVEIYAPYVNAKNHDRCSVCREVAIAHATLQLSVRDGDVGTNAIIF
jgi:hypothetical protein